MVFKKIITPNNNIQDFYTVLYKKALLLCSNCVPAKVGVNQKDTNQK
jgi:hypothetical protein